jgi:hypothetical protein
LSPSIPLFSYAHVHSAMSAHSTNFISPTIVCQHVMAVRRHALYVDTDTLTRLHNAVNFLRKIIKAKGA